MNPFNNINAKYYQKVENSQPLSSMIKIMKF